MELVESNTTTLWPFGPDKRMVYAIYAHFNTMIKRKHKLDLPSPVIQRLHHLRVELKSLLQIITGMKRINKELDFELSTILDDLQYPQRHRGSYTLNDEAQNSDINTPDNTIITQTPQTPIETATTTTRISSRSHSLPTSSSIMTSTTNTTQKQTNKKKKKRRQRSDSQSVLIYDFEGCSPSEASASEPELNPMIIEDYRSDASVNSDAECSTPRTTKPYKKPIDLIPKNYKTRYVQRPKSFDFVNASSYRIGKNGQIASPETRTNTKQKTKKNVPIQHKHRHKHKPKPPPKSITKQTITVISSSATSNKCNSDSNAASMASMESVGSAPPPQLNFDIVDNDTESVLSTQSMLDQTMTSSFMASSFASTVLSSMNNNNAMSMSQSVDDLNVHNKPLNDGTKSNDNERILALESDSDIDSNPAASPSPSVGALLARSCFDAQQSQHTKTIHMHRRKRNKPKPPPRNAKSATGGRRNTLPTPAKKTEDISGHSSVSRRSTGSRYRIGRSATVCGSGSGMGRVAELPDLSKMFEGKDKEGNDEKDEDNYNDENYAGNQEDDGTEGDTESTPRPPLPRKSDKSVTLKVVHKTWKKRQERPLPKPNDV